jgi:hypothetical protein
MSNFPEIVSVLILLNKIGCEQDVHYGVVIVK